MDLFIWKICRKNREKWGKKQRGVVEIDGGQRKGDSDGLHGTRDERKRQMNR